MVEVVHAGYIAWLSLVRIRVVSYHPQLSKSIWVERRGEKILNSKDTDGWKDEHLVQEAEDSLAEKEHQNCQKLKKIHF